MNRIDLITISLLPDLSLSLQISSWLAVFIGVLIALALIWKCRIGGWNFKNYEIDQAEIGTGNGKIRFKPNLTDRQVAYAIWVELSTRKIGLPIDVEHDVVAEVYDSWYSFFGVTRDLIKSIPVNKVRSDSTQKIIRLSIDVLNEGLRPHLTKWQARFRRWYEAELTKNDVLIDPQEIQKKFPKFDELKSDIEEVNRHLINYRAKMRQLVD